MYWCPRHGLGGSRESHEDCAPLDVYEQCVLEEIKKLTDVAKANALATEELRAMLGDRVGGGK